MVGVGYFVPGTAQVGQNRVLRTVTAGMVTVLVASTARADELLPGSSVPQKSDELGWLLQSGWLPLLLAVPVALSLLVIGRVMQQRALELGKSPRVRGRSGSQHFDLEIAKLEHAPRSPIAEAKPGRPGVHVEGLLHSAHGTLGGCAGRECVWHNMVGAATDAAIASDLVLVADDSGRAAIESLNLARVIAPREAGSGPRARETLSLYIGDRVQILGPFTPGLGAELPQNDPDTSSDGTRVWGRFGADGAGLQVRVLERAPVETDRSRSKSEAAAAESEPPTTTSPASSPTEAPADQAHKR